MALRSFFGKIGDFGMGGGGNYRPNPNSETRMMHNCEMAVFFMPDGRIHVAKNRFEEITGNVSSEQFLKIMLRHLAKKVYKGNALIFQEGLIEQLEPMIKKVLKKNKVQVRKDDSV